MTDQSDQEIQRLLHKWSEESDPDDVRIEQLSDRISKVVRTENRRVDEKIARLKARRLSRSRLWVVGTLIGGAVLAAGAVWLLIRLM